MPNKQIFISSLVFDTLTKPDVLVSNKILNIDLGTFEWFSLQKKCVFHINFEYQNMHKARVTCIFVFVSAICFVNS